MLAAAPAAIRDMLCYDWLTATVRVEKEQLRAGTVGLSVLFCSLSSDRLKAQYEVTPLWVGYSTRF